MTWNHETVGKVLLQALKQDDITDLKFLYSEKIWDLQALLEAIKFTEDDDNIEITIWSFLKNTYPINCSMSWRNEEVQGIALIDYMIGFNAIKCFRFCMIHNLIDFSPDPFNGNFCGVPSWLWEQPHFFQELLKHDIKFPWESTLGEALQVASQVGDLKSVKLIVEREDADVNYQECGIPPIGFAVAYKRWDIVEFFLKLEGVCLCPFGYDESESGPETEAIYNKSVFDIALESEPKLKEMLDKLEFQTRTCGPCRMYYENKKKRQQEQEQDSRKRKKTEG